MAVTYTYSISGDFPNQKVAADALEQEIEDSSITSATLEDIDVGVSAPDNCDIIFDVALSSGDETTLDGIVAAHQGDPLETFPDVNVEASTWRLVGSCDVGVAMMQLKQNNESGEFVAMENAVDGTAVVQFRQTSGGHPIFNLRNAAGTKLIRFAPNGDSYVDTPGGFGIGTTTPDPSYAVDVVGDVNTDSAYRVGGTTIITYGADVKNLVTARFDAEYSNGSQSGPSYTVDWSNGQKQTITLAGNITSLTLTAPSGVGNFLLRIVQDATGGRTITWPGTVKWAGGTAPTLTTDANAEDIITFYYNGTSYYGVGSLNFA
jgi:hypothetical protein